MLKSLLLNSKTASGGVNEPLSAFSLLGVGQEGLPLSSSFPEDKEKVGFRPRSNEYLTEGKNIKRES